jgi:alkyl hydroperoxide reductase subunit AhpC
LQRRNQEHGNLLVIGRKSQMSDRPSPGANEPQEDDKQASGEEEVHEEPKIYDCPCHYCRPDDLLDLPDIGSVAPPFHATTVTSGNVSDVELSSFRDKWLVLFTFPTVARVVTASELVAFSENYQRFTELNCDLLALTMENHFTINNWRMTPRHEGGIGSVNFIIASDLGHCISRRYGLIDDDAIPLRATFLIDPEGIVRHIDINPMSVPRSVEETLRLVKAYQFVAETGEVCPAQWKEGEMAIKPDVNESRNYFGSRY